MPLVSLVESLEAQCGRVRQRELVFYDPVPVLDQFSPDSTRLVRPAITNRDKQYMVRHYTIVDPLVQEIYPFAYVLLGEHTSHYVHIGPFRHSVANTKQDSGPIDINL